VGVRPDDSYGAKQHGWLAPRDTATAVEALVAEGWRVEVEGRPVSAAAGASARLTTGIDWFEVDGAVDYGGASVALHEILAAAKRQERWVTLADGRLGLLPADWQERWSWLDLGQRGEQGEVRFARQQAWLDRCAGGPWFWRLSGG